ncbi:hypothetical protein [Streptomyces pristinaespiralis]|jgi:hypothetical protein|uniref:hypothetical protein n=1 Tax=Streptomyces pristinaespiralis TaxID=38300 RepID=UPI0038332190
MVAKRGNSATPKLPEAARLMVPVMAATGGSGRSTVANLLACGLALSGRTAVLDTGPRLSSPWPAWTQGQPVQGLSSLPSDRPLSRALVHQAAAQRPGLAAETSWQVLTDGREWHSAPLSLPQDPAAWHQLAAIGGWQSVVIDTSHPVAHDVLAARCEDRVGLTRGWCNLPFAIPVLCAAATASGVQALQQAVMAMHAEGLPLQRTVAVLVSSSDGRPPAVVRAGATMLAPRTAAVIQLPHDPSIRAHGLREPSRLRSRTRQAATVLADAVLAAAHSTWGEPLPSAPRPRPLTPSVPTF